VRLSGSRLYKAGQLQWHERTMVSIFCSSLPFSKACFRSFWAGTSAALSWCTCCPQSAPWSSPLYHQALRTRLYEFSRNVAMLKSMWVRRIAPIPKFYGCHKSCATSGVPQRAMPPTSRTGGMLRVRIAGLAERDGVWE
jgi:hypothetical protein